MIDYMEVKFTKKIYSIRHILKAAYVFTDVAYIYLDDDDEFIYVHLEAKSNQDLLVIQGEMKNEALAQLLRESISERTGGLRELIYQRAMSSSMIVEEKHLFNKEETATADFDLENILVDWFAQKE